MRLGENLKLFKTNKWLVVSHDAGGAEILSSWVKNSQFEFLFLISGPAIDIFSRKLLSFQNKSETEVEKLLEQVNTVILSTSGVSDFERKVLKRAKQKGIKTISFLDHWVNYEMRFRFNGSLVLPDELWVGDQWAYDLAKEIFTNTPIKFVENPYLKEIAEKKNSINKLEINNTNRVNILYCSQPTILDYGYTEYDAIKNYLNYLHSSLNQNYEIRIRLHPAEMSQKYNDIITSYSSNRIVIYEAKPNDIVEDCEWANWVVGCETMAMVIALKLGKKVFSNIPKGGKASSLPFSEIVSLFN